MFFYYEFVGVEDESGDLCAAALLVSKKLAKLFKFYYSPRGLLVDYNNEELVTLIFITRHLQTNGIHNIDLTLPYVPNGRQDRAPSSADVFTLKYFCQVKIVFSMVVK